MLSSPHSLKMKLIKMYSLNTVGFFSRLPPSHLQMMLSNSCVFPSPFWALNSNYPQSPLCILRSILQGNESLHLLPGFSQLSHTVPSSGHLEQLSPASDLSVTELHICLPFMESINSWGFRKSIHKHESLTILGTCGHCWKPQQLIQRILRLS